MTYLYQWTALSPDTNELPPAMGINSTLSAAQAAAGKVVATGKAFAAIIVLVAPALGDDLYMHYVACGPNWIGRRTVAGDVLWLHRSHVTLTRAG